jgi:hypothetical protein
VLETTCQSLMYESGLAVLMYFKEEGLGETRKIVVD